ncbi:hypothetical protein DFO46_3058 [Rhizobium sp. AG855]|nr:hypothetical protein DFO46_3058 [Rhizobium sp. AG855]
MVSFARGGITIGCSILNRTRIRIGQICGRQPLAVFRLASAAGAGLLLAAGEIFTKLHGDPQPTLLLGRTQLRFSTAGTRPLLSIRNVGFCD